MATLRKTVASSRESNDQVDNNNNNNDASRDCTCQGHCPCRGPLSGRRDIHSPTFINKQPSSTSPRPSNDGAPNQLDSRPRFPRLGTSPGLLQRLTRLRWSNESHSTALSSPSSGQSSPSRRPFSPFSPTTPQLPRDQTTTTTPLTPPTPPSTPYTPAAPTISGSTLTSPIPAAELAQLWTHAAHLASAGRNASARLLFTHLLARAGVPPHLLPLLPLNAALIMLKEHAPLAALHTLHVTARDLCPAGPLLALAAFLMGVAAWDVAVAADAPSDAADAIDVLGRAKVFFDVAREEMRGAAALSFACAGLDWPLGAAAVARNVVACDRAITLHRVGDGAAWAEAAGPIARVPEAALFAPPEVVAGGMGHRKPAAQTVESLKCQCGGGEQRRGSGQSGRRQVERRLMKDLPPIPASELSDF